MSVNKVILVGNLGKDPEVRYINESTPVANFTLATTEAYKDKNGNRQEITEWHNIVAWRGLAEIAEKYLKKGKQVYIEGRIRSRSYDDKDGNKRYVTEIVADTMQMLGRRENDEDGGNRQASYSRPQASDQEQQAPAIENIPIDDDLPF